MPVGNPIYPAYCFEVLEASLKDLPSPSTDALPNESSPLFVSWHIHSEQDESPEGELRGCIGNFSPLPLRRGLKEYALISALEDNRFHPITLDELPHLSCTVSLLTNFSQGADYLDWTLGTHGIRIHFSAPSSARTLSGTFLPEVAVQQGWDKEETIRALIRKAGYSGPITSDFLKSRLSLERYTSQISTITYQEYVSRST